MLAGSHRNAWPDETGTGGRTNRNTQSAAHEYVKGRYEGSELQYATQFLRDKEMDQMEPPKPDYQEAHEQESAAGGSVNAEPGAEEMPPLSDEDMIPVTEEEGAEGSYY